MTYQISDLIKKATQLANIEDSSFISYNENLTLLNENLQWIYSEIIQNNCNFFISTFTAVPGENLLPDDCYQIKRVRSLTPDNLQLHLATESECDWSYSYTIKNGCLFNNSANSVLVEYYVAPPDITFPNKDNIFQLPDLSSTETLSKSFKGFNLIKETNYKYKLLPFDYELDLGTDTAVTLLLTDNAFVCSDSASNYHIYFYRSGNSSTNTPVIIEGKTYYFSGSKIYNEYDEEIDDYTLPTSFASGDIVFEGKLIHSNQIDSKTIKDASYGNGSIYVLYNDKIIVYDTSWNILKTVNLDYKYRPICFSEHSYETGYGVLVYNSLESEYYEKSIVDDTTLDFPKSIMWEILSYKIAISYLAKQGADCSQLKLLLDEKLSTFYSSIKQTADHLRIANIY